MGALDALLQICVPPSTRRICYASIPDFTDNAYYLFRHALRTRSAIEHVWLVQDPDVAARISSEFARIVSETGTRGHRLRVVRWRSLAGYWAFLRSRYVTHTHGVHNFSRVAFRRVRMGLWHGMPIKCIGRLNTVTPNPNPPFATHCIATSALFRYVLANAFGVDADRVLVVGQPRNDALIFPQQRATGDASIRKALGIDSAARLLVWLPTYRAEGSAGEKSRKIASFVDDLSPELLRHFADAARAARCAVLIKLHPFEQSDIKSALAQFPELRVLSDAEWRRTGIQLYDLLGIADALVSDVSSAMIDFAITARPLACFGFSARNYPRDLVFPLQQVIDAVGIDVVDDHRAVDDLFRRIMSRDSSRRRTADLFVQRPVIPASESILQFMIGGEVPAQPSVTGSSSSTEPAAESR